VELHHLYRAMDFLEANKEEIEQAIYFQVSDLLNLDVDIVFYDTTSLHFEIDEEDEGDGEGQVKGRFEAGNKSYPAPRKPMAFTLENSLIHLRKTANAI
jgi:hypothetical protein